MYPIKNRPDGTYAGDLPAYRRIMPFLMKGRNESAVYFEHVINIEPIQALIKKMNQEGTEKFTFFHLFIAAIVHVLSEYPRLNRFIVGRRVYQRDGIYISFSMKKAFDDSAPVVVVKRRFDPGDNLSQVSQKIHVDIREGRSDRASYVDRELKLFTRLPRFLISIFMRLQRLLDYFNLLPLTFIRNDPMYASVFIANLGSLGLESAYHHLYEYGNIPFFVTIGSFKKTPVVEGESVVIKTMASIKFTYDERIEDGFYCLQALKRLKEIIEKPEVLK